jgi:hypothetical protein
MDKDQIEQRWDGTMGQTAISCTDRKLPGSLPELRLTDSPIIDDFDTIYRSASPFWEKNGTDVLRAMNDAQAESDAEL